MLGAMLSIKRVTLGNFFTSLIGFGVRVRAGVKERSGVRLALKVRCRVRAKAAVQVGEGFAFGRDALDRARDVGKFLHVTC